MVEFLASEKGKIEGGVAHIAENDPFPPRAEANMTPTSWMIFEFKCFAIYAQTYTYTHKYCNFKRIKCNASQLGAVS